MGLWLSHVLADNLQTGIISGPCACIKYGYRYLYLALSFTPTSAVCYDFFNVVQAICSYKC